MGNAFITSKQGCIISASNNRRSYTLNFSNENEAECFERELLATQEDFNSNGRDDVVRKKALFSNQADCSISMNLDIANSIKKWPFKVKMSSIEEMHEYYEDMKEAIWGAMPSI